MRESHSSILYVAVINAGCFKKKKVPTQMYPTVQKKQIVFYLLTGY